VLFTYRLHILKMAVQVRTKEASRGPRVSCGLGKISKRINWRMMGANEIMQLENEERRSRGVSRGTGTGY
jgi:hypothetical protein